MESGDKPVLKETNQQVKYHAPFFSFLPPTKIYIISEYHYQQEAIIQ